ncbi:MAG: hypothetical protein IJD58_03360 [Lachnospiraceae bacterium]|nr:hypothetical protein [Lachnospiraceae bacterium]
MGKFRIKKLNNQGSTFVLSLLVITLLTTLALALANASLGNMTMKSMDRGAKKTFYTAETLLDEIRVGIGYNSIENLASAYETVLTNLVQYNGTDSATVQENTEANIALKKKFVENVLSTVTGGSLVFGATSTEVSTVTMAETEVEPIKAKVIEYITSYITNNGYTEEIAKITSVGNVKAYKEPADPNAPKWSVIIEDVAVSYKTNKNGEIYFSNITADLEIEYPNMTVDFSTSNTLNDYINYCLVADNNLIVEGKMVNINASAYAGNIIDIAPSGLAGANVTFQSMSGSNINVICGGDLEALSGTIRVGGNETYQAQAHFIGTNIWCTNIATRKMITSTTSEAAAGAVVTIADDCYSYVRDDLSVDAQNSDVTVGGEYYGYMYDGNTGTAGHAASSAIIVNGKNSKVSIATKKLLLAGRAYIDVADGYMTGESLSLKGDQEVYLIPAEFLGGNSNPMPLSRWNELGGDAAAGSIVSVPDTYFAKAYLNSSVPYLKRTVGDRVYLYWNFKDKVSATKYIKDVLNGKDENIKSKLNRYTENLFGDSSSSISVGTTSADIYATGILLEAESGAPGYTTADGVMTEIAFTQNSLDYRNRYDIYTHLLASIPWDSGSARYYVLNAETALEQMRGFVVNNELNQTSIIYNIINMDLLNAATPNEYNPSGAYFVKQADPEKKLVKIIKQGSVNSIPDGVTGGIIIATGNVNVDRNFEGLIIAGGDINIIGDVTITTNPTLVEELILGMEDMVDEDGNYVAEATEDKAFKNYFYSYMVGEVEEDSREQVKIEELDYKDLVNFDNWRKYED